MESGIINPKLVEELFKECNTAFECIENNRQLLKIRNEIGVNRVIIHLIMEKEKRNCKKILKLSTDILEIHNKQVKKMNRLNRLFEKKQKKFNENRNT